MAKRSRKFDWQIHEMSAPRRSDRWATTDRGWYYGPGIEGERPCFGHYLDYGPCDPRHAQEHPEGTVHACACVPGGARAKAVKWCRTPEEARLFIETQAMGWEKAS